ncbi:Alpha/Beta hydrolase protein [Dimargaris cristalligena]|uniref:Alpha/Beta hydrolase protein n=1 Tax=Dimargaris cristalligena TaxID=215637 RepID=A0A4P9ZWG7_9FUNG|nr:Alpha/Beta hydrolase protein [Dimargaris cristalligena]|eukprot:RKP38006.1 Alpha/Beta hydrolase protein [Dimargaris cristalligena]
MVILYLHGQGGSRERSNRIAVYKSLQTTIPTAHIIALDYRGYGDSDGLPDNETLVISDAIAIWNYATQHVPASRILIYGHSLGSGIGAQLCRIVEQHGETPLGLCLEGAMASMPQVMFEYRDQPFLKPLRPFPALVDLYSRACVFRFDTGSILPLIQCPILLIHGREDRVIEIKFAYDMFYSLRPGHGPPTAPKHALSPLVEYAKVQAACKSRPIWEEGRLFRWPRPDKSAQMAWFLELDYADHDSAHVYESTQSVLGNFVAEINSS